MPTGMAVPSGHLQTANLDLTLPELEFPMAFAPQLLAS